MKGVLIVNSTDWEILTNLFKFKNITKTSKFLRISQPAVTYRLNKLEEEFGTKIIHRNKKGVIFTAEGEMLVNYSQDMMKQEQKIKGDILNQSEEVQGVLRLSSSVIFTRYKLPSILSEFSKKYPLVKFDVNTGWSEEVFHSVHNDSSQVGILRGDYNFSSIELPLMHEKLYVVSSEKIELEDLPDLPRIYYNTDSLLKKLIDEWWIANYIEPPKIPIKVDNMETCKEFVSKGLGFAILPNILLEGDQELYKTPCINSEGDLLTRKTSLILKKEQLNNKVVKAFYEFISNWEF
ncbi:LysR family transcriptional regulator [Mammaliicoccus lentus]|nr:LysR family transcriptional regulator [Mammaliicoccus lentus]TFU58480.1 LysR family transcriptional regulator [Mammaliicoccus lentus]